MKIYPLSFTSSLFFIKENLLYPLEQHKKIAEVVIPIFIILFSSIYIYRVFRSRIIEKKLNTTLKLADNHVKANRLNDAHALFLEAIKLDRENSNALTGLKHIYVLRTAQAVKEKLETQEEVTKDSKWMMIHANVLSILGKLEQANEKYEKILTMDKTNTEASRRLANNFRKQNKLDEAERAIESALQQEIIPDPKSLLTDYVNILYANNHLEKAISFLSTNPYT